MGPPPDPRQILVQTAIEDIVLSILLGLSIFAIGVLPKQRTHIRFFWMILGQAIILTSPLIMAGDNAVWGAYPTIDKQGSLLFYQTGIHQKMIFSPIEALSDPILQLIGFHMGHLWVTEFFDIFVRPFAAFNCQALLNVVLGWWCMWLLLHSKGVDKYKAMLLAFPFGMGAHLFRDINWYTIEKSAVFWLPLFWWSVEQVKQEKRPVYYPGIIFFGASFINLYWGMILGIFLAFICLLEKYRGLYKTLAICTGIALGIGVYQKLLMHGGTPLATPEDFIWKRAAFDSFTLWPLAWNRIPIWLALHPIALFCAVWAVKQWDSQDKKLAAVALFFAALSLGPWLIMDMIKNPLYLAFTYVPGMWRFSEPEIFFHLTWMIVLFLAAKAPIKKMWLWFLYVSMIGFWLLMIRQAHFYPTFSKYIPGRLPAKWQQVP